MQEPYLIDGLKFDLRLYVLVLSCEPLRVFLHTDGLVRFATHDYEQIKFTDDEKTMNNVYRHLTNYALNKDSGTFKMATGVDDDKSHKRSLKKVLTRMKIEGIDTDKMMGDIKDVIVKTLFTVQLDLSNNYRSCQPTDLEGLMAFEILGFDILIDKNAKPWLLEVNHAPSFATDSPLDYEIKKNLFCDVFKLLNMSVDRKRAKLMAIYEEKKLRMMQKLSLKQRQQ